MQVPYPAGPWIKAILFLFTATLIPVVYAQLTINTPSSLTECGATLIKWSGGSSPYFLSVQQADDPSEILENLGEINTTSFSWTVNIVSGTNIGFSVTDSTGAVALTGSTIIRVGTSSSCINGTGTSSSSTSSPSLSSRSLSPSRNDSSSPSSASLPSSKPSSNSHNDSLSPSSVSPPSSKPSPNSRIKTKTASPSATSSVKGGSTPSGTTGAGSAATSAALITPSTKKTPIGAIVGGVIGGLVALIVASLFVLLTLRRRRRREGLQRGDLKYLDLVEGEIPPDRPMPHETSNPGILKPQSSHSQITSDPTVLLPTTNERSSDPSSPPADVVGAVGHEEQENQGKLVLERARAEQTEAIHREMPEQELSDVPSSDPRNTAELSSQVPAPAEPAVGTEDGDRAEESALLRELRELQIVRRLEEIHSRRAGGMSETDSPPPLYE